MCLAAAFALGAAGGPASAAQAVPASKSASSGAVRTVIPLGRAVGIKLFSDGVLVVGLSEIPTQTGR